MAAKDLRAVLDDVRQTLRAEVEQGLSDRDLLTRFLERRDEAAFAALVRRHATMVWAVCRRTLRNSADVEDAFQATFLVLIRKAASVRPREMLANWLYGVARQTALKARATAARRWAQERQVAQMPEPEAKPVNLLDDLHTLLDEELSRLPDKYRAVLVLCDLEGQTRSLAARHLGVPEGTVASRLARARALLARRLARHGLAVTGASLAATLAEEAASAAAPLSAVSAAIRAACSLAVGPAGHAAISAEVGALTESVMKAMLLTQLKKMTVVLLILSLAAIACGLLTAGRQTPTPPPQERPRAEKEAAPFPVKAEPVQGPPADPLPDGAVAQFGSPRLQDFTIDRSATFSPDGKLLATSGANSPICVWDVATGARVRTHPNRGSVFDLRWKPDGKLAALIFFGHDVFLMQEFSGTGGLSPEQEARLQDEATRRERRGEAGNGKKRRLDYCFLSADGRRVVAIWVMDDKGPRRAAAYPFVSAQTSDTAKAEREVPLPGGYGVWLSGDGKVLLAHVLPTADQPNKLRAFDFTAGKDSDRPAWELALPGRPEDHRPDVCFSPDGKRVLILFWDGRVELWDGPAGKRLRELPPLPWYYHQNSGERRGIDLSADGQRLALIERGANGAVGGRVVDVATGRDVCRLAPRPMPQSSGVARFSADGKWLARVSYGVAAIWNAETGADACPLPGHRGEVNSLAVLARGKTLVTAGADLSVRAWDPATGREVWRAALPQVVEVKFATPDGAVVVAERTWGPAGPAHCLDAATGRPRALPGKLAEAKQDIFLACSPDGTTVVTLDAKKPAFRIWSWPAGALRTTVPLLPPGQLRLGRWCPVAHFTPDGKHLVAAVYYSDPGEQQVMRRVPDHPFVETWDLAAGKLLGRSEVPIRNSPVLLPHATGLYFLGKDNEVRNAVTGRLLVKLRVPEGRGINLDSTRGAALSPDGRTVAIGTEWSEQQLLLFEVLTGRYRGTLPVPGRFLAGLAFLPDGRLVSLGMTATVWSVGLHPAPAPAAGVLGQGEVVQEWERLGDPDPEKAWPALNKLAGTSTEAVEFIRNHVHAVPKLSNEALSQILRNLDAEEFRTREAASRELNRLGAPAVPRVKAWLAEGTSAEVTKRLEAFLAEHDRADLPAAELRALRAVALLEAAATPAARKLLGDLAGGESTARLTQEAAAASRRVGQRP
jgi:RNA polymerase sigma factor (sigma-70 family)